MRGQDCRSTSVEGTVMLGQKRAQDGSCWGCSVVFLAKTHNYHSASPLPGTCVIGLGQPQTMLRREGEYITHNGLRANYM